MLENSSTMKQTACTQMEEGSLSAKHNAHTETAQMTEQVTEPSAKPTLPLEIWSSILGFADCLTELAGINREVRKLVLREARIRVVNRLKYVVVNTRLLDQQRGFLQFLTYPIAKSSVVPCVRVSLKGEIVSQLLFVRDDFFSHLEENMRSYGYDQERKSWVFAIVSNHTIESTLHRHDKFRRSLLRSCGIIAFEAKERNLEMKWIEVRWWGTFNGRERLFGIPLIVYVPRICDRNHVHQEVFKSVQPFLKVPCSSPPYRLTAYNINSSGLANEIAFTADYMVVDSNMHPVGENLCIYIDFGMQARSLIRFELFGEAANQTDNSAFAPLKSHKLLAALVERDCGLRLYRSEF